MPRIDLVNDPVMLTREVMELSDPFLFEKYCGSCDNFDTEGCPFRGRVDYDTEWRRIRCDGFMD